MFSYGKSGAEGASNTNLLRISQAKRLLLDATLERASFKEAAHEEVNHILTIQG